MYADNTTPHARYWAIPLGLAVVLYVFSVIAVSEPWKLAWNGLQWVSAAWAAVNLFIHVKYALREMSRDDRAVEYKFSHNFLAETLAHMNQEQLRAWSRGGRPLISVIPTPNGPVERLDGEPVFLYTVWYMLRMSNGSRVYPINNFKTGTFHFDMLGLHEWDDYTQAKAFTAYLCLYGAAEWSVGNTSATWKNGYTPEKVMANFGLERDSYDIPELA